MSPTYDEINLICFREEWAPGNDKISQKVLVSLSGHTVWVKDRKQFCGLLSLTTNGIGSSEVHMVSDVTTVTLGWSYSLWMTRPHNQIERPQAQLTAKGMMNHARGMHSDLCGDISLLCMLITLISVNTFHLVGWWKSYDPQLKEGWSKIIFMSPSTFLFLL